MADYAEIEVLIAFNGLRVGDKGKARITEQLTGYEALGLIKILGVVQDGKRKARSRAAESGDPSGEPGRTAGGGAADAEPSEDPDAS